MSEIDKLDTELLEALTGGKKISIADLPKRMSELVSKQEDWVSNGDVKTSVLYSGRVSGLSATDIATDMADRGGDKISALDDTRAAKFLGDLFDQNDAGTIHTKYGNYIDFENLSQRQIGNSVYESFRPTSEAFVKNISGHVITVTPESVPSAVYGTNEVPQIAKGIESGRITHVNGTESAAFKPFLEIKDPDAQRLAFKEAFDESFAQNLKEARPEAYRAADGKPGYIAADTKDMQILGAGDDVEMSRAARPSKGHIPSRDFIEGVESNRAGIEKPTLLLSDDVVEARAKFDVLSDPKVKGFSVDPDMETQHFYSKSQNAVVTIDKEGGISLERGTPDRPAGHIFGDHLHEAKASFPDFHKGGLPVRITGGVNSVAEAVTDMNKTGVWKTLGSVAEDGGKFLGKASKILGPVGVAAATYEAATLEAKAREFEDYGALSEEAVTQYDLILVGHIGQATVDPTLVGGEALTKTAFETWADHHDISDEVKAELAPGLLIDMVGKAGQAIYDQYEDVKGYGKELARDVTEGLEDIAGIPSHRDFVDEMDPYSAPSRGNGFRDLFGLPPSFGGGSWQEGALQLNGHEQITGGASIQQASFSEGAPSESSVTVSLNDAIGMLEADHKALNASAKAGQASPVQIALDHPDAAHMFQNLRSHGVTILTAEVSPDMGAEDRAGELLLAGRAATLQAGIPMPSEQRELEVTQELNNSNEEDYSVSV